MSSLPNVENYSVDYRLKVKPFLRSLNKCRLKRKLTDIIIKVGNKQFVAHRIVMENSCLTGISFDNLSQTVFRFDEKYVKTEIVEDLLTFLYTHKITFNINTVHLVLIAAHHLKIEFLLSRCEQYFIHIFELGDILDWFSLSLIYELETFKNFCLDYMIGHTLEVFGKEKLVKMSFEDFHILLQEMNNRTNNETVKSEMLDAVIAWVAQKKNRSSFFPKLLRQISLSEELLRKIFLRSNVAYLKSNECSRFLVNCLKKILNYTELFFYGGSENPKELSICSVSKFKLDLDSTNNEFIGRIPIEFLKPVQVINQCGVFMNNKIYLIGGHVTEKIDVQPSKCDISVFLTNCVVSYDLVEKQCLELPICPRGFSSGAAVAYDKNVCFTGGIGLTTNDKVEELSQAFRLNVRTMEWKEVKSMKYARFDHQLVELNGYLYAIAGRKINSPKSRPIAIKNDFKFSYQLRTEVEKYNPINNEWTTVASCFYKHDQRDIRKVSAVVHCDKIYVCSDIGFEMYCPEAQKWTPLSRLDKSITRLTLLSMQKQLIAFSDKSGTLHCFDIAKKKWSLQAEIEVDSSLYENLVGVCSIVAQWRL